MRQLLRKLQLDSRGATAIEYGLIAALIVVAMMAGLGYLGRKSTGMWNNIAAVVDGA